GWRISAGSATSNRNTTARPRRRLRSGGPLRRSKRPPGYFSGGLLCLRMIHWPSVPRAVEERPKRYGTDPVCHGRVSPASINHEFGFGIRLYSFVSPSRTPPRVIVSFAPLEYPKHL